MSTVYTRVGAIELSVFSDYYHIELDVVDVQSQRIDRFGEYTNQFFTYTYMYMYTRIPRLPNTVFMYILSSS